MSHADLASLPNLGAVIADELIRAGVTTPQRLKEVGSVEATRRIAAFGYEDCYTLLFALEGAIRRVRWYRVPKEERADLKLRFDAVTKGAGS